MRSSSSSASRIYYFAFARNQVKTDDAYVNGNMVRLTPQISGTVIAINTDETQFVQRGQVLVQLDPHDTEVALAQAKASLGQTVRDVAQLFAQEARDAAAGRRAADSIDAGDAGSGARPPGFRRARRVG